MENMKIGGLLSLDEAFIESRATWLSSNEPDKVARGFSDLYRKASAILIRDNVHDDSVLQEELASWFSKLNQASPQLENRLQTLKLLLEARLAETFIPPQIKPNVKFITLAIEIEQKQLQVQSESLSIVKQHLQYLSRLVSCSQSKQPTESIETTFEPLWEQCKRWLKNLIDRILRLLKIKNNENDTEWAITADRLYGLYRAHPTLFEQSRNSMIQLLIDCYAQGKKDYLSQAFPSSSLIPASAHRFVARYDHYFWRIKDFNWRYTVTELTKQLDSLYEEGLCDYKKTWFQREKEGGNYSAYLSTYQEMNDKIQQWSAQALEDYSTIEQHLRKFPNYLQYMDKIGEAFLKLERRCIALPRLWLSEMDKFFSDHPTLQFANSQLLLLHGDAVEGLKLSRWVEHVCYSRRATESMYFKYEMEARNNDLKKNLFENYQDSSAIMVTDLHVKRMPGYYKETRLLLPKLHSDKQQALGGISLPEVNDFVIKQLNELRQRNEQAYRTWSQSQWGSERAESESFISIKDESLPETIEELGEKPQGPAVIEEPSSALGLFILVLRENYLEYMNNRDTHSLRKQAQNVPWISKLYPEPEISFGCPARDALMRCYWYQRATSAAQNHWQQKEVGIVERQVELAISELAQAKQEAEEEIRQKEEEIRQKEEERTQKEDAQAMVELLQRQMINIALSVRLKAITPSIAQEAFIDIINQELDALEKNKFLKGLSREQIAVMMKHCLSELFQSESFGAYQSFMISLDSTTTPESSGSHRNTFFSNRASGSGNRATHAEPVNSQFTQGK